MADRQKDISATWAGERHFAITPANGVDLAYIPRALYVLTSGNLAIRDKLGAILVYPVTAGQVIDFRAVGIEATNTTATVVGWD